MQNTLKKQLNSTVSGRSMIEMLGVLSVVGVLGIGGLAGYTAAMNKVRANRVLHDTMILAMSVFDQNTTDIPGDFIAESGHRFSINMFDDGFEITAANISKGVCEQLIKISQAPIESVTVNDGGTSCNLGEQNMTFAVAFDGVSGGNVGGGETPPVDPCDGISCHGHGICFNGSCICDTNYYGNYCETYVDPCEGVTCNGHGTCQNGLCVCEDGYTGDACETAPIKNHCGTYTWSESSDCVSYAQSKGINASWYCNLAGVSLSPEETCDETCPTTCKATQGNVDVGIYTCADGVCTCENGSTYPVCYCLAGGTQIALADGSTKPIEDIDYTDTLKVWDFDKGEFASAHPLFIKIEQTAPQYNVIRFDDGSELKTINQHRLFNKEAGRFTYPMSEETPIGTTTFTAQGKEVKIISKEIVDEPVRFYNIITERHFNCFSNNILTSCRLNNLYPIADMCFVKDKRQLIPYSEYACLPRAWYDGLRLAEQPRLINRGNDVVHDQSMTAYVQRLIRMDKKTNAYAKAV